MLHGPEAWGGGSQEPAGVDGAGWMSAALARGTSKRHVRPVSWPGLCVCAPDAPACVVGIPVQMPKSAKQMAHKKFAQNL